MKHDNIKGYPGYYVSRRGRVWSRKKLGKWVEVVQQVSFYGYPRIHLSDGINKRKWKNIHKLVALVYVPNPDNKPMVLHSNDNKVNNYYKNLYWGTAQENSNDAKKNGKTARGKSKDCPWTRGENNVKSKLTNMQRVEMITEYLETHKLEEVSTKYNISTVALWKTAKKGVEFYG